MLVPVLRLGNRTSRMGKGRGGKGGGVVVRDGANLADRLARASQETGSSVLAELASYSVCERCVCECECITLLTVAGVSSLIIPLADSRGSEQATGDA